MKAYILYTSITFTLLSCGQDDATENTLEKPSGSDKAVAVYNNAYIENYDPDEIEYIVLNATDAYVLVDPFQENISESIQTMKANGNEVGAYISIGTGEDWREDFADLEPYLVNQQWGEWPGEYFVNKTTTGIIEVMKARIDKIAGWGCDWVEFDNMDWALYDEVRDSYNLEVTKEQSISYFQELCDYVHQKGMKCMAKNFVENAENFDGVTYESYNNEKNWWDQSGAQNFLNAGKLVVIVHYNESNCNRVYSDYMSLYNKDISFICEDVNLKKYVHYNN